MVSPEDTGFLAETLNEEEDIQLVEEVLEGDLKSRYTGDAVQMYLDEIGKTNQGHLLVDWASP